MITIKSNILYDYQISDKQSLKKILLVSNYQIYVTISLNQNKIKLWKKDYSFFRSLHCLCFIDDIEYYSSKNLLIFSCEKSILFWNIVTGLVVYKISELEISQINLKIIDGFLFYYGQTRILEGFTNYIFIWNIDKTNKLNACSEKVVNDVISLQKGSRIAYCYKNIIIVMNYSIGVKIQTLKNQFNSFFHMLNYYKDSSKNLDILISLEEKQLKLWDLTSFRLIKSFEFSYFNDSPVFLKNLMFFNQFYLIIGFDEGVLYLVDLQNGKVLHIISNFKQERIKLNYVLFENNLLTLIGKYGRLMVFDLIFNKSNK